MIHTFLIDNSDDMKSIVAKEPNTIKENLIETHGTTEAVNMDYVDSLLEIFETDIRR